MSVAGVHEMTVSARTVIKRELQGMELVLVMDNTGSMRGGGKMDAMKDAAVDLVEILYGDRETVTNFWVGVVPYAANVNIGSQHDDWLITQAYDEDAAWQNADPDSDIDFGYHPDHYQPTTWKGCVEAREFPRDSNDDTPDLESWYPYLWRTTLNNFENPDWVDPGDYDDDGDVDEDDAAAYVEDNFDPNVPATWGAHLTGDNEWNPDGTTTSTRTTAPGPISAAARRSRRWSPARPRCSPRSRTWLPGIAAVRWPMSALPGGGASSRPAGAASGTATCPRSCPSTTTRRT
jgi:hypothetical protein